MKTDILLCAAAFESVVPGSTFIVEVNSHWHYALKTEEKTQEGTEFGVVVFGPFPANARNNPQYYKESAHSTTVNIIDLYIDTIWDDENVKSLKENSPLTPGSLYVNWAGLCIAAEDETDKSKRVLIQFGDGKIADPKGLRSGLVISRWTLNRASVVGEPQSVLTWPRDHEVKKH